MSTNEPPAAYPVGAIVNGHVWTGSEWVVAQAIPAPPAPAAPVKPPMSERFDALPVPVRILLIAGIIAAGSVGYWLVSTAVDALP